MDILLNEQLKKLRKAKGNTQEDLAAHLGITMQAVSKWERAEGYPDITLLPSIAAYYNVSVDDLLGLGENRKREKIEEYRNRNQELFRAGKNDERVALWRAARNEFPNDLSVIYELMYALQAQDRKTNADEVIAYGERLLNESTDSSQRSGAVQSLCFTYYFAKGDAETAKKYAHMASGYEVTINEMLRNFLEGDEAVAFCQRNIQELVDLIGINTNAILWKGKYTPEDTIKACRFVLDCYQLLYPDGNCGFYHCRYSEFYEIMAMKYRELEQDKDMFACLEKAAEHAIKFDTLKDGMFTAFMVNKVKISSIDHVRDYPENKSGLLLKTLQKDFAAWEKDERLQKIIKQLEPVAFMG